MTAASSVLRVVGVFLNNETNVAQTVAFLQAFNAEEVCDSIWLLDEEMVFGGQTDSPKRNKLCELVAALSPQHFDLLCCTLSLELLERAKIISEIAKTKIVLKRMNTNQRFRQSKFNLVKESSEGFAKLLCELLVPNCESRKVLALMGEFQLDPNRVLDLCLDLMPENPLAIVQIITNLFSGPGNKLYDLLCFKLNTGGGGNIKLFDTMAQLLVSNLISLDQLLPLVQQQPGLVGVLFASLLALPKAWSKSCIELLGKFPPNKMFALSQAVEAFQTMLMGEISELYRTQYSPISDVTATSEPTLNFDLDTMDSFVSEVSPVLLLVGPEAVANAKLLTRLVRLFGKAGGDSTEVCGQVLLPALSLLPTSNPQVGRELWNELVRHVEVERRFAMYHLWHRVVLSPKLAKHSSIVRTKKACQSSLKRFCLDVTKNVFPSMQLSKAANNNPLLSFEAIFQGIRMQVDVLIIDAIVSSFQFTTPLSLDVLVFLLCRELCNETSSEANAVSNARLVSKFFAQEHSVDFAALIQTLYANCAQHRNLLGSLTCLEEMVQVSSGLAIVNEYDETLLRSAAGGKLLRFLSRLSQDDRTKFADQPNATKIQQANLDHLVCTLQHNDMHGKLLVALARCRDRTFDCMDGSFDSQSALFDSCTSSLIQLADVLRSQRVDLHSIATNEAFSKPIHSHIFRSDGNNDDMFWQASLPDLLHPKQEYRYQVDKLLGVKKATSMALALSLKQECEEMAKRELAFKTRFNHDQPVDTDFFITKVMPRMLFSQEDALFTALYLQRVGQDQLVLEAIFSREFLLAAFFPATHRELQCLGIFLAEMLVWAKAILNSNEEDEGVLKSYSKLLVDLVLDAMKCMNEDVLVSHAFQLTMYLVNREGGLFPSHLDVVEYFIKLLEEDVLLTFAFIERNNLLLQKLRRRITAETPTPSTSVPPSNTLSTEEESEKTSTPAPPLTTPPPAVPVAPVAKPAASVKPAAPVTLPPHLARRNADNKQPPKKESPPPVVAASSSSVVAAKGKEPPRVLPLQNKGQAKQPAQRGGSSEEPVVRLQPREEQSSSSRSGRGGGDAKNEPRARHDEPFARGTQDPKDFKRGDSRREDSKREDPKDARREDPKDSKRDDPKDSKREDPKDSKREDPKDSKREDPKDSKREDPKDSKREDPKDSRREDPKDSRREDSRRDDFRREDNRRDDSKREDNRRDDSKREDNRRDDSKREDNRRNNDPRRDDSRRGSVEKQPSRNRNRSPPRPPPPPPPAPTAASNRNRSPQRSNKRYREEDEREQSKRNRRG